MPRPGLYIQIPFCESKCSFCNFSSQVARRSLITDYAEALLREIERVGEMRDESSPFFANQSDSLYFGGGTPPILGPESFERLVQTLRQLFSWAPEAEFTVEVTPGSADVEFLRAARRLGVNRLSVGAQSFDDRELRAVGRLHTADETWTMVRAAQAAGFDNVSLDLIAGLPHQTCDSWLRSLETAIRLRPRHVSVYLFEVDEKSRLGSEVLRRGSRYHADTVPDEDLMAEAYETARVALQEAGYVQYEISNFGLPGFESRHNRKYWQLDPYLGLGAGAHSFDGRRRWSSEISPDAYIRKISAGESVMCEIRELSSRDLMEEFFFLGLRQRTGVDLSEARERWGDDAMAPWAETVAQLVRAGLLERSGDRVWLTEEACLVSNEVFEQFIRA